MNYAWANPSTGIREQTSRSTPERMLAEAKLRVWEELRDLITGEIPQMCEAPPECHIYRQEPIGSVTIDGFEFNNGDHSAVGNADFAWTDPATGKRIVSESIDCDPLVAQLKTAQENRDSLESVVIYATWPECTVSRSDPRPADVPPEEVDNSDRAGDSPDIDRFKQELETVVILDDSTKLAKATAWALLDIAESLRRVNDPKKDAYPGQEPDDALEGPYVEAMRQALQDYHHKENE